MREAAISVVKTVAPAALVPGVEAVYTIVVANAGPSDAATVGVFAAAAALAIAMGWATKLATGMLAFDMTQTWVPELISLALFSIAQGSPWLFATRLVRTGATYDVKDFVPVSIR